MYINVFQRLKLFVTNRAAVKLRFAVTCHVSEYRRLRGKHFPANRAVKGLFAGVYFQMDDQIPLLCEPFSTNVAAERLLSRVDSHVDLQMRLPRKGFVAFGARKLTLFVLGISLGYFSVIDAEGFFARVHLEDMFLNVVLAFKARLTSRTAERSFFRVTFSMRAQVAFAGEALAADGAGKGLLSGVDPQVSL